MHANLLRLSVVVAMMATAPSTFANVITDWDQKALAVVTPMASLGGTSPYMAQRMMGMVHAAMFDAVNSIDRQYRPYVAQLPADPGTSKEAAAAAAAAAVLATIDAKTADEMKAALATYLASIPDGLAKWSASGLAKRPPRKSLLRAQTMDVTHPMSIAQGLPRGPMCRRRSRSHRCGRT